MASVRRSNLGRHRRVAINLLVDDRFNPSDLFACDRLKVDEVEAETVGRDERSGLLDVRTEDLAQRRVQKMRGCVISPRRVAEPRVDLGPHGVADAQVAGGDVHVVGARQTAGDACDAVHDRRAVGRRHQLAGVRHLPAGLEIERRPIERDVASFVRAERVDRVASLVEHRHDGRVVHLRGGVPSKRSPTSSRAVVPPGNSNSWAFFPPPNALPARALPRWVSIARSYPSRSTRTSWVADVSSMKS